MEVLGIFTEIDIYEEKPDIWLYFANKKGYLKSGNMGINSLQFDRLIQFTNILYKVGEGEDIPKD